VGSNPTCSILFFFVSVSSSLDSAPRCSACGEGQLYVIEIRRSELATRRRRKCTSCGYRTTTYEVEQITFKEMERAKNTLSKILKLLNLTSALSIGFVEEEQKEDTIPCFTCSNVFRGSVCSFDFPEGFTMEAVGCLHFVPTETKI